MGVSVDGIFLHLGAVPWSRLINSVHHHGKLMVIPLPLCSFSDIIFILWYKLSCCFQGYTVSKQLFFPMGLLRFIAISSTCSFAGYTEPIGLKLAKKQVHFGCKCSSNPHSIDIFTYFDVNLNRLQWSITKAFEIPKWDFKKKCIYVSLLSSESHVNT